MERHAQLEQQLQQRYAERLPTIPLYFNDRAAFTTANLEGPRYGVADSLYWNVERWRLK